MGKIVKPVVIFTSLKLNLFCKPSKILNDTFVYEVVEESDTNLSLKSEGKRPEPTVAKVPRWVFQRGEGKVK